MKAKRSGPTDAVTGAVLAHSAVKARIGLVGIEIAPAAIGAPDRLPRVVPPEPVDATEVIEAIVGDRTVARLVNDASHRRPCLNLR
jgi:hypothetical protein